MADDLAAPGSHTVEVEFGDRTIEMVVFDDGCWVSAHLSGARRFYEERFLAVLREIAPSGRTVIDVGAHIGNHSRFLSEFAEVPMVAVEPNPATFALLERNLGAVDRATLVRTAVGAEVGTVSMAKVHDHDVGTNAVTVAVDEDVVGAASGDGPHVDTVPMTTLDLLWAEVGAGLPPVGLVKLDVEGLEAEVLRGARGVLDVSRPIVTTEIQDGAAYDSIADELAGFGYRPAGIFNPTATIVWLAPGGCGDTTESRSAISASSAEHGLELSFRLASARHRVHALENPPLPDPLVVIVSAGGDESPPLRRGVVTERVRLDEPGGVSESDLLVRLLDVAADHPRRRPLIVVAAERVDDPQVESVLTATGLSFAVHGLAAATSGATEVVLVPFGDTDGVDGVFTDDTTVRVVDPSGDTARALRGVAGPTSTASDDGAPARLRPLLEAGTR